MIKMKAFTLIELLVVIAIIAILAAILFPVFAQARESARTSSCLSNEKQISLGVLQYVQDYDERFPLYQYAQATTPPNQPDKPWGPWANTHITWDKAIQPYVKNIQIFRCPSNDDGVNTDATGDDSKQTGVLNYAMNGHLDGLENNGTKLATVRFPAVTILLSETFKAASAGASMMETDHEWGNGNTHAHQLNGDNNAGAGWDASTYGQPAVMNNLCHQGTGGSWGQSARLRAHHGGANYAYGDGHTKFAKGDASCVVWDRTDTGSGPKNESGSTMTYIP